MIEDRGQRADAEEARQQWELTMTSVRLWHGGEPEVTPWTV